LWESATHQEAGMRHQAHFGGKFLALLFRHFAGSFSRVRNMTSVPISDPGQNSTFATIASALRVRAALHRTM